MPAQTGATDPAPTRTEGPYPAPGRTGAPRPAPAETGAFGPIPAETGAPYPVCDDPAILGEAAPPVAGPGGCGIARPVRLHSVAGVALDPQPMLACATARALRSWIEDAAAPALDAIGEDLAGLGIAADYTCRNVNRDWEGDLSEHAYGRAIDIARLRLESGGTLSVAQAWGAPRIGAALARMLAGACGPFSTVLGPEADALHQDHFHFDIKERRNPYCP